MTADFILLAIVLLLLSWKVEQAVSRQCRFERRYKHRDALNEELAGIEGRIAYARQAYNETVMRYSISLVQFPGSLVARVFAFKQAEPLQTR